LAQPLAYLKVRSTHQGFTPPGAKRTTDRHGGHYVGFSIKQSRHGFTAMNARRPLLPEALRDRLLLAPPELPLRPSRSDFDLNPQTRPAVPRLLKPAAVLIPIVTHSAPAVLFTLRSEGLPQHAGQVCFPGGRAHVSDASLVETALREMTEETGIAAEFVTVAGFLGAYETVTGYAVLPVVGLLREGFTLTPNADEVEGIFEVPLAFLIDPANRQEHWREWQGGKRRFYAFHYETHYIWGATAAILTELAERLHDAT
jgi:8-oxo-dGTP pyrophosphatase MutT (NUDIX family)